MLHCRSVELVHIGAVVTAVALRDGMEMHGSDVWFVREELACASSVFALPAVAALIAVIGRWTGARHTARDVCLNQRVESLVVNERRRGT